MGRHARLCFESQCSRVRRQRRREAFDGEHEAFWIWWQQTEGALVHLPIDASWLNQAERLFSIVHRKTPTPNDVDSLDELAERLVTFGER
jgi:hypothetical protein